MNKPILIKNYDSEGAISAYRIVKYGATDGAAAQSSVGTDAYCGVADSLGGEAGGRVDVIKAGIAEVEYGAAVTRGAPLMADAAGKAITATVGKRVIGHAEVSGVSGDIGSVHIAPGDKV